jgi:pimeloyl-ACP methyl ester carboxylesterase
MSQDIIASVADLPHGEGLALPGEAEPFTVIAPDGVHLAAQSWGNPAGPAIVMIHGFGQCHLSWLRQLRGPLARDYRLITFDLRGHGGSDKPPDPARYDHARPWADDIAAVLDTAGVARAVLVGWSFGGRVSLDYLAMHGTARIAGLNLVGSSISPRPDLRGRGGLALRPLMNGAELSGNIAATREFLRRCFGIQPDEPSFQEMLAYNMLVPPLVRAAVNARPDQPEEVLRGITIPVLVTTGDQDRLVPPAVAHYAARTFPRAELSVYPGIGHSPFFEAPGRFARELGEFARHVLS